jgi:hypothetical protein
MQMVQLDTPKRSPLKRSLTWITQREETTAGHALCHCCHNLRKSPRTPRRGSTYPTQSGQGQRGALARTQWKQCPPHTGAVMCVNQSCPSHRPGGRWATGTRQNCPVRGCKRKFMASTPQDTHTRPYGRTCRRGKFTPRPVGMQRWAPFYTRTTFQCANFLVCICKTVLCVVDIQLKCTRETTSDFFWTKILLHVNG